MRTLEIRRHSFTKKGPARGRGSHLSREGVVAARRLGERVGAFDHVVASTSPRTTETAIAMGFAVDELMEMPSPTETGEVEFHSWRGWNHPCSTLRAKALASPAIAAYLDEQASRALTRVGRLGEGGRVLVVGHGGWIESVVARLLEPDELSRVGGSFWHLDAVRLSVDERSRVRLAEVERHQSEQWPTSSGPDASG